MADRRREAGSGDSVRVDRHVLASPADAFDTAWATYGWTPDLEGRVGRLEEELPWGSQMTRRSAPARLSGPAESVVQARNLDRLGSAVLAVDGKIGFSVWGAVGEGPGGGGWRVATHTLLMDAEAFRRVGGYPEGLLMEEGAPAPWLRRFTEHHDFSVPSRLDPIVIEVDRRFSRTQRLARLEAIGRLRSDLLTVSGWSVNRLAAELSGIYEALSVVTRGGELSHVVVRGSDHVSSILLRLVWLALPLEDRVTTTYVTEQRKTERPKGHLLSLPEAEWGQYVPDASFVVGESEALKPTEGRRHWASLVADPAAAEAFDQLDARTTLRGRRLLGRDDLSAEVDHGLWRSAWVADGPTLAGAVALIEREVTRKAHARLGAAGFVLGCAVRDGMDVASVDRALRAVRAVGVEQAVPLLRGAIRALRSEGPRGLEVAGLLRCRSASWGDEALGLELYRLVDRESDALRALISSPGGGHELVEAALPLAVSGDSVGRELVRMGASEGLWEEPSIERFLGRVEAVQSGSGRAAGEGMDAVLTDILRTLVDEGGPAGRIEAVARALTPRLAAPGLSRLLEARSLGREASSETSGGGALDRVLLSHSASLGSGDSVDEAASVRLLRRVAGWYSPRAELDFWRSLVRDAAQDWIVRPAVLDAFVEVLGAGRAPLVWDGEGEPGARVAEALAGRILSGAGASGIPNACVEPLLRFYWEAGSLGSLDRLSERPATEAAVVGQLMAAPAPAPLFRQLRQRLSRLIAEPGAWEGLELRRAQLEAYAPGLVLGAMAGPGQPSSPRVFIGARA